MGRVLESGRYVHGAEHDAFEGELAEYLGARHCIGVANGTDALELAIRALAPPAGLGRRDGGQRRHYASTAARRAGLRVRYADVDRASSDP